MLIPVHIDHAQYLDKNGRSRLRPAKRGRHGGYSHGVRGGTPRQKPAFLPEGVLTGNESNSNKRSSPARKWLADAMHRGKFAKVETTKATSNQEIGKVLHVNAQRVSELMNASGTKLTTLRRRLWVPAALKHKYRQFELTTGCKLRVCFPKGGLCAATSCAEFARKHDTKTPTVSHLQQGVAQQLLNQCGDA